MTTLRASIGILILIATLANGIRRFERDNSNQQQQQQQQQQVTTKQLQQEQPESEITFGLNNIPDDNIVEILVNAKEGDFKLEQLKVAEKDDEFQPAQIRYVDTNHILFQREAHYIFFLEIKTNYLFIGGWVGREQVVNVSKLIFGGLNINKK